MKRLSFQLLGPIPSNAESLFPRNYSKARARGARRAVDRCTINHFNIACYFIDAAWKYCARARLRRFRTTVELTRLPGCGKTERLRAAGILQLASEALPLALAAGGGNEEPVRDGDREQERCDAFEQLPTCTHANLF